MGDGEIVNSARIDIKVITGRKHLRAKKKLKKMSLNSKRLVPSRRSLRSISKRDVKSQGKPDTIQPTEETDLLHRLKRFVTNTERNVKNHIVQNLDTNIVISVSTPETGKKTHDMTIGITDTGTRIMMKSTSTTTQKEPMSTEATESISILQNTTTLVLLATNSRSSLSSMEATVTTSFLLTSSKEESGERTITTRMRWATIGTTVSMTISIDTREIKESQKIDTSRDIQIMANHQKSMSQRNCTEKRIMMINRIVRAQTRVGLISKTNRTKDQEIRIMRVMIKRDIKKATQAITTNSLTPKLATVT